MNDIRPDAKAAPVRKSPPPKRAEAKPQPQPERSGNAGRDGATISREAKEKEPSGERKTLLEALKTNLGGNDRVQNQDRALGKLSTDKLKKLKKTREFDKALTKHEEDHHEVAADLARRGPQDKTRVGEDGQEYRVSGKVMIDTGVDKDPQKTVKKMKQVRAAALAPDGNVLAPLSEQDKKVAREATEKEQVAQSMLDGNGDKQKWAEMTGAATSKGPNSA